MTSTKFIHIFVLLFFYHIAFGQQFEWGKSQEINYDLNPEFLNYVITTDNVGHLYFAGLKTFHENYIQNAYGDNFLVKYDQQGNELFNHIIYGSAIIKNMTSDAQGNLLIVGMTRSEIDFGNANELEFTGSATNTFLAKVSENSDVIWLKNLTAIYGSSNAVRVLKTDISNNVYVGWDDNQNGTTIIKKFDPSGNEMMEIIQTAVPFVSSLDVSATGEIVVVGSCASTNAQFAGVPFNPGFTTSTYIAKYDATGAIEWVNFVEDINCQHPRVKFCPQGNIYFSGRLSGAFTFGEIPTAGPALVYDFFLAKISNGGSFLWVAEVPEVASGDATVGKLTHLGVDEAGNSYLTGFTRNNIEWNPEWQTSVTPRGLFVISYNPEGELRWVRSATGALDAQSIAVFSSEVVFIGGTAFGIVQLDGFNITSPSFYFPFVTKMKITPTGLTETKKASAIIISPNPFSFRTQISLAKGFGEISRIELYDLSGNQVLMEDNIGERTTTFYRSNLNQGLYFVKIFSTQGNIFMHKMIVK